MSAASIQVSTVEEASKVPETSPMSSQGRPLLRRMTSNGMVVPPVAEAKMVEDAIVDYTNIHGIRIVIKNPKNRAVAGAVTKVKNNTIAGRTTASYLMSGVQKWFSEEEQSVETPEAEEHFVKYVWHEMRQRQRDNKAAVEARRLQIGLDDAKHQLESHYAEFPDERKTDDELVELFRKLGVWSSVASSEQRRIASKKRHEKEEKLIDEKFCGDRAAYNRWKALNEQVSRGRIRDVSSQLLVKFAQWFEENPDFLYPGSKCIAVETAENKLIKGLWPVDYAQVGMTRAEVSKEHILAAISSVMGGLQEGTCTVTLKFDRSPKQFTMTDKYPLLNMHGCQRLLSGSEHHVVAVHGDKLVFKETTIMIKRLPEEFHNQLKGHCQREGLFKEVTCRKVFEYTPGLVTSVLFHGQTADGDKFHIRLRLTARAGKTFDFGAILSAKRVNFTDSIKKEASNKEAAKQARIAAAKAPAPPSPMSSSKNLVQELAELSKLFKDGLLSELEFKKAKRRLL